MSDAIIRLAIAYVYAQELFAQFNTQLKTDEDQLAIVLKEEAQRDFKGLPEQLLPLGRTETEPRTQLGRLFNKIKSIRDKQIGIVRHDLLRVYLGIGILQITALINIASNLIYDSETIAAVFVRKFFQILIILELFISLNTTAAATANCEQIKQKLPIVTLLLLALESVQHLNSLSSVSASLMMEKYNSPFRLQDLTVFALLITCIVKGAAFYTRFQLKEKSLNNSQTIINRLANELFKDDTNCKNSDNNNLSGHAILQLHQNLNLEEPQQSHLNLLRYNKNFGQLVSKADGTLIQQSQPTSVVQNSQGDIEGVNQEAQKNKVTQQLLKGFRTDPIEASFQTFEDLTFKGQFMHALEKFKAKKLEDPKEHNQKTSNSTTLLFTRDFFDYDIGSLKDEDIKGSPKNNFIIQQICQNGGIRLSVYLLCQENWVFLIKAKKLSLSKSEQCPVKEYKINKVMRRHSDETRNQINTIKIIPKPSLKRNGRKSPKKRVSFDEIDWIKPRKTQRQIQSSDDLLNKQSNSRQVQSCLDPDSPMKLYKQPFKLDLNLKATKYAKHNSSVDQIKLQPQKISDKKKDKVFQAMRLIRKPNSWDPDMNLHKAQRKVSSELSNTVSIATTGINNQNQAIPVEKNKKQDTAMLQLQSQNSATAKEELIILSCTKSDPIDQQDLDKEIISPLLIKGTPKMIFKSQNNEVSLLQQKANQLIMPDQNQSDKKFIFTKKNVLNQTSAQSYLLQPFPNNLISSKSQISSKTSNTVRINQMIRNNQIFVNKIIHDIKHPTQALSDSIAKLISENQPRDNSSPLSNNSIHRQKSNIFSDNIMTYKGNLRVNKSIKQLKRFVKNYSSTQNSDNKSRRRQQLSEENKNGILMSHDSSLSHSSQSPFSLKRTRQHKSKKSQSIGMASHYLMSDQLIKRSQSNNCNLNRSNYQRQQQRVLEINVELSNLRQSFWSIPIQNFELLPAAKIAAASNSDKNDNDKENDINPPNDIEQEDQNQNLASDQDDQYSEDSSISEGKHSIDTKMVKLPKTKNMSRDSVRSVVSQKRINDKDKNPYQYHSLALERLFLHQQGKFQSKTQQPMFSYKGKSRLSDIHKVIDSIKAMSQNQNQSEPQIAISGSVQQQEQDQRQQHLLKNSKQNNHIRSKSQQQSSIKVRNSELIPRLGSDLNIYHSPQAKHYSNKVDNIVFDDNDCFTFCQDKVQSIGQSSRSSQQNSQNSDQFQDKEVIDSSRINSNSHKNESDQMKRKQKKQKLSKLISIVFKEREFIITILNKNFKKQSLIQNKLVNMQGQVEMMMTLLKDLMNQAQMANNTFTMVNDYFNCINLIKKCIIMMDTQVLLKNITLNGPVFTNPIDKFYFQMVFSDDHRYGQIILNFISNSIKFTQNNGVISVLLEITNIQDVISVNKMSHHSESSGFIPDKQEEEAAPDKEIIVEQQTNSQLKNLTEKLISFKIIFRDSGCGISEDNKKKLFMNFSKLHESQNENKNGVGLGLSICKDIIHALGGSIDIQSELGKGTDFIISLNAICKVDEEKINQNRIEMEGGGSCSTSNQSQSDAGKQLNDQNISISIGLSSSYKLNNNTMSQISEESQDLQSSYNLSAANKIKRQSLNIQNSGQILAKGGQQYPVVYNQYHSSDNKLIVSSKQKKDDISPPNSNLSKFSSFLSAKKSIPSFKSQLKCCLLANDDPFLLDCFSQCLSPHFDQVDTAFNGKDAVELVKSHQRSYYSAIVLDIDMPVMNGMESCIKIKQYLYEEEKDQDSQYRKLQSSQRKSNQSTVKIPLVYALTSEVDEVAIRQFQRSGFKSIYNVLDQATIKEILSNAGLPYNESNINREDSLILKFDEESQLLSSKHSEGSISSDSLDSSSLQSSEKNEQNKEDQCKLQVPNIYGKLSQKRKVINIINPASAAIGQILDQDQAPL